MAPEVCLFVCPLENRGRREDRVLAAPAVSRADAHKEHAHEHTGSAEAFRPSLRSGLTAYFVLSPENGSLASVAAQGVNPTQLDASTAASGPHDFAVRFMRVRLARLRVHRISPRVRDDREPPLVTGETRGVKSLICPTARAEYFCARGWTGFGVICPSGRFVVVVALKFRLCAARRSPQFVGWAKRKRAHHQEACSAMGGGHGEERLCPPYNST